MELLEYMNHNLGPENNKSPSFVGFYIPAPCFAYGIGDAHFNSDEHHTENELRLRISGFATKKMQKAGM